MEEAWRIEEERQAEVARQAEAACRWEEAQRQKAIDKVRAQMEWEQQEEMQARARAITVMQGSGTPGPSTVPVGPMPRACERCTVLLWDPEGCAVSEKGKVQACMPCQKVRKACNWPLGPAEAAATTGSRTEGSRKPALRHMVKQRTATMTNASP